jgi:hypothetical protein
LNVADLTGHLRQLIEKLLIRRGRRNASCRVFSPAGMGRSYTVILEEAGIREQFFLDNSDVERFGETGNEQFLLAEIRTGIRNLDRLVTKKKTARGN